MAIDLALMPVFLQSLSVLVLIHLLFALLYDTSHL